MKTQIVDLLKANHAMPEHELVNCLGFADFERRISLRRELLRLADNGEIQHFTHGEVDWYCLDRDRPASTRRFGRVA